MGILDVHGIYYRGLFSPYFLLNVVYGQKCKRYRGNIGQQNVTCQGGFARAADTGDGDQALQGDLDGDGLQVVQGGGLDGDPGLFALAREMGVRSQFLGRFGFLVRGCE